MSDWKHDPNGGDIIEQVRNAPDYVREYAAMHLLAQGCPHRHIRKKLDISARQFQMIERKFRFNSKYDPVHIPTSILPPNEN
jgi:hypothetical protein